MSTLLIIIITVIALQILAQCMLDQMNAQFVLDNQASGEWRRYTAMDEASYNKSVAYTLSKLRFAQWESIYDGVLLCAFLGFGLIPWIYQSLLSAWGQHTFSMIGAFIVTLMILRIPDLPLGYWAQFKLEARYGFNRSTLGLWIADRAKGAVVGAIIFGILLWICVLMFQKFPENWWLWFFGIWVAFQLIMLIAYPKVILPLFNKLTPLEDGELKERLVALSKKSGFDLARIEVLDGSKRSGHSNAMFTGFGRFRRIILYDTLINQLSPVEIEGVVAHEIGHYKLGHIPKLMGLSFTIGFCGLAVAAYLVSNPYFLGALDFSPMHYADKLLPTLMMLALIAPVALFWMQPLMNKLTRKYEYQADEYAHNLVGNAEPLVQALRKLHKENLSNSTPHPLYSAFYYSHPTVFEREKALTRPR
ncbi:MAG: hypothetical protein B7X06_03705 [Verrucomicrobia bacterium 21-51-4]|nr:MAG: hypothetical protein B7X06_03705 [Verrucomicrobia bacterium 21-51-4]HQU09673.1 M48 family metallopeptidase [Opitutales bacterium]